MFIIIIFFFSFYGGIGSDCDFLDRDTVRFCTGIVTLEGRDTSFFYGESVDLTGWFSSRIFLVFLGVFPTPVAFNI